MDFAIHPQEASDAFWPRLVERRQLELRRCLSTIHDAVQLAKSISPATMAALAVIGAEARPTATFEIGTFIGNSTRILARYSGTVHTCDMEDAPALLIENVIQYPKGVSTAALRQVKGKVDLFFLDGRLQPDDLPLVSALMTPATIFVLDDCQGYAKGVVNAFALVQNQGMYYAPPPSMELFTAFGITGRHRLGLMFQAAHLQFMTQ